MRLRHIKEDIFCSEPVNQKNLQNKRWKWKLLRMNEIAKPQIKSKSTKGWS